MNPLRSNAAIRRSMLASVALAAVAAGTIAADAAATRPSALDSAALVFEADGLDGSAGTTVTVGAFTHTIRDDLDGMETYRLDLPTSEVHTGRLDVEITAGTQSEGGLDEFDIRDVRLELGDALVATDDRYDASTAYRIGDGADPDNQWGNALTALPGLDRLGQVPGIEGAVEVRTPLVPSRVFRFQVPFDGPAEAPAGGSLPLVSVETGGAVSKPHDATPGQTTDPLSAADGAAVGDSDGLYLETVPQDGFASQEFTFDSSGVTTQHLDLTWEGQTLPGRGATLYAWDVQDERWMDLATTREAESDAVLRGVVDLSTMADDTGQVRLLVQEAKYDDSNTDFAFAWMSDTQFYSERYPDTYDAMSTWVARNADAEKIIYGVHTGDITQNYNAFREEWERASAAMGILEDAGIPYGITTGNHDLLPDGSRTNTLYDEYFPVSRFEGMATPFVRYGGSFDNHQNHYDLVEYDGTKIIVVYLAQGTNAEDIAWANDVLAAHRDHAAILATHQYIDGAGNYGGTATSVLEGIIVPNDNVFMMLCGHYTGGIYNVRRYPGTDGATRVVLEVLQDYQGGDDGGAGYLQLLKFDLERMQMDIYPYSPVTDEFDNGGDTALAERIAETGDDVTLSLDFAPVQRRVATDRIAVTPTV